MAMKEIQYINNYPICDAEARNQLANKENKGHKHEEYATKEDLSNYALKSEIPESVKIPTKVSTFENDAEYISYYDLYLKDENGEYLVDEDGNYIIEEHASIASIEDLQEQINELNLIIKNLQEQINELLPN